MTREAAKMADSSASGALGAVGGRDAVECTDAAAPMAVTRRRTPCGRLLPKADQ